MFKIRKKDDIKNGIFHTFFYFLQFARPHYNHHDHMYQFALKAQFGEVSWQWFDERRRGRSIDTTGKMNTLNCLELHFNASAKPKSQRFRFEISAHKRIDC